MELKGVKVWLEGEALRLSKVTLEGWAGAPS